jgi:DNA-binding NarL/FixJ family response regulator
MSKHKRVSIKPVIDETATIYILAAPRLLRETLQRILGRASLDVIGSAENPRTGIEEIAELRPDIILINGGALPSDSANLVIEALKIAPQSRAVLFGVSDDPESFLRAVCAGIVGYVSSDSSASELVLAIRCALRDEAVCPPRLCLALFKYAARQASLPKPARSSPFALTRREQQLVPLISEGLTNKEIAVRLGISEQTVKNHVSRMLRKTDRPDRLSAARAAESWDWLFAMKHLARPRLGDVLASNKHFPDGQPHEKCISMAWIRTQENNHEHVQPKS